MRSCRPGRAVRPGRRDVIRALGSVAALAAVSPARLLADDDDRRVLPFVHTHTRERLTVAYYGAGRYLEDGLASLRHFLRDFRTGDTHEMDPALFDILHELRLETGTAVPFQVISGFRSPRSNTMLRDQGRGVAASSLHMQGRAIDVRLADVETSRLRDVALALKRGGVGYYRESNFVHVDTGRVRRW
jgi:uncharacterized protein YcbK (DUF882 family)